MKKCLLGLFRWYNSNVPKIYEEFVTNLFEFT